MPSSSTSSSSSDSSSSSSSASKTIEEETLFGEALEADAAAGIPTGVYEFTWDRTMQRVTTNWRGTTGFGTIKQSSVAHLVGTSCRIHLCKANPCMAPWPAGKYGKYGPVMHLQPTTKPDVWPAVAAHSAAPFPAPAAVQSAVAASSGEAAPSPADADMFNGLFDVPEPPPVLPPPAPVTPPILPTPAEPPSPPSPVEPPSEVLQIGVEPEPAAAPATVMEPEPAIMEPDPAPVEPEEHADHVEAPVCPEGAALKNLEPPAPVTPIEVSDGEVDVDAAAVAVDAAAGSQVAALYKIKTILLALAREIRTPNKYVGYSAFILMGLRYQCQPCVRLPPGRKKLAQKNY